MIRGSNGEYRHAPTGTYDAGLPVQVRDCAIKYALPVRVRCNVCGGRKVRWCALHLTKLSGLHTGDIRTRTITYRLRMWMRGHRVIIRKLRHCTTAGRDKSLGSTVLRCVFRGGLPVLNVCFRYGVAMPVLCLFDGSRGAAFPFVFGAHCTGEGTVGRKSTLYRACRNLQQMTRAARSASSPFGNFRSQIGKWNRGCDEEYGVQSTDSRIRTRCSALQNKPL